MWMVLSDLSIGIGIHFCRGKPPTGGNLSRTEAGKITGKESLCEHKGVHFDERRGLGFSED
jgi:hypothetical protein